MIEVQGAEQLAHLSKRLKEAADKGLQRELSKALRDATAPVKGAARESALATLPRHGGLNVRVANSKFSTRRRPDGLRVSAQNAYALKQLDEGVSRHPVFGHRDRWVVERVNPGWWSKPVERLAPEARAEIIKAMDRIAAKIGQKL